MPAKPLTPEQLEDAARLRALFKAWQRERKDAGQPSSQIHAGHELGFGQSALSQYLRGDIPLNIPAAVKFSKLLGKKMEEFAPGLATKFVAFASDADFVFVDERADMHVVELKAHSPGMKSKQSSRSKAGKSSTHEIPVDLPDYVLTAIDAVLDAYHNESPREVFDGISALLKAQNLAHTGKVNSPVQDETARKRPPTSRLTDEANRAKDATKSHLATRSGGTGGKEEEGKHRRYKGH